MQLSAPKVALHAPPFNFPTQPGGPVMPENPEPAPDCDDEPKLTDEEWQAIEVLSKRGDA